MSRATHSRSRQLLYPNERFAEPHWGLFFPRSGTLYSLIGFAAELIYPMEIMSSVSTRNEKYRFSVGGQEITPLAALELYLGNTAMPVLNVSQGGLAIQVPVDSLSKYEAGDLLDVSISIRERAFPMQLEIKDVNKSGRLSCSFMNLTPAFNAALKEFLAPKVLGASIQHNVEYRDMAEALQLEEGAVHYENFTGINQTGVFVWMDQDRKILRLLAVSRDLVLSWTPHKGLQTGRTPAQSSSMQDVHWDRVMEYTVFHYLADILLAWRSEHKDRDWMEALLSGDHGEDSEFVFPSE